MGHLADTPEPPYVAVVFTSIASADRAEYGRTADRMIELAAEQPGFLGVESAGEGGEQGAMSITVSYWESDEAVVAWRSHAEHAIARETGRERWYDRYELRVARVERAYGWVSTD